MSRVITKTIDDGFNVTDPDDRQEPLEEFCLVAHVHFLAPTVEEAVRLLAMYFAALARGEREKAGNLFHAGQLTLARREELHDTPEARH